MTTSTFFKTSLRALRAFAFVFVSAMLVTACGGGPQAALPFAPSAIPSSSMALEAADGSDAAAPADAAGTLGKGSDKDKDGDKGNTDKGGNDKDKKKDGTPTTGTPTTGTDATVVEIKGTVSSVTNACPAKTFVVGLDKTVMTADATTYKHGNCNTLLKDAVVVVHATTDANGRLVAKDVEFVDGDMDDDEEEEEDGEDSGPNPHDGPGPFEGTVSSFRGACPMVTFNLKGMRIVTTETTTYEGGTCEMLRPNVKVVVAGTHGTGRRVFNAETITITRRPNGSPGTGEDDEDDSDSDMPGTGTPTTPTAPTTPTK